METNPGKRVRMFREHKGYKNASVFAKAAGLSSAALSSIETGRTCPSFGILAKLATSFPDLNIDWLLTGDGSMLREGRALTPFLPGGEVNKFGATVMPPGAMEHALGPNFGEDIDLPDGTPRAAPLPKTRQEFIESLLRENDSLRAQVKQACAENDKLYKVIDQMQDTIRTSQEQLSTLLGKPTGSQHAPGKENDNNADPPRPRAGYRFYDEPEQECVVRSIFSAPVVREMKTAA